MFALCVNMLYLNNNNNNNNQGPSVAQSVERWTSGQVMISQFMRLSPTSGLLLSAQSLLWLPCPCSLSLTLPLLALSKNIHYKKKKKKKKKQIV